MIKKYGLGVIAIIIAISAAAFTAPKNAESKPLIKKWFVLNSGATALGTNTSYSLAPNSGDDPGCPTQPHTVCAVRADPDAGNSNIPSQSQLTTIKTNSVNFTVAAMDLEYIRP